MQLHLIDNLTNILNAIFISRNLKLFFLNLYGQQIPWKDLKSA